MRGPGAHELPLLRRQLKDIAFQLVPMFRELCHGLAQDARLEDVAHIRLQVVEEPAVAEVMQADHGDGAGEPHEQEALSQAKAHDMVHHHRDEGDRHGDQDLEDEPLDLTEPK